MTHILEAQQFDRPTLDYLFERTNALSGVFSHRERSVLRRYTGRMLFNVFYEPSTRTRMSFASAAQHLGLHVVDTENARDFSSAIKGESLEDTIRVLCQYCPDMIVLRHFETGAAERAAQVSSVPIINAGDGRGQHPTQALLDLYTIQQAHGRVDGLTVLVGGDLANGRTVRSLVYLLTKYQHVKIVFVAPPQLRMGDDLKKYLTRKGVSFHEEADLAQVLPLADVVYWTRIQKERLVDVSYDEVSNYYRIGTPELALMKPTAIIMHPLPRVQEITTDVDRDPRALYFRQAGNGMFIRMAVIEALLEGSLSSS